MNFEKASEIIVDAKIGRREVRSYPSDLVPATTDGGYALQRLVLQRLTECPRRVGFKIACTSPTARNHLGVDTPLFGELLQHTVFSSGQRVFLSSQHEYIIEAECALRLSRYTRPKLTRYSTSEVMSMIGDVAPSIEIVRSVFARSLKVPPQLLIAENSCHVAWICGKPVLDFDLNQLAMVRSQTFVNERFRSYGSCKFAMGSPVIALTWLLNEFLRLGIEIPIGEWITTGLTTGIVMAQCHSDIAVEFDKLGRVTAELVSE